MEAYRRNDKQMLRRGWYVAVALAVLAGSGCNPPLPSNAPRATGEPVVAAEVVGHWFRLVGKGEPQIEVRPAFAEAVVNTLVDRLLKELPKLSDENPLYIHVSDVLDEGAVADVPSKVYVAVQIPESQQVAPKEQEDGSLLFEGDNLMSFLDQVAEAASSGASTLPLLPGGIDPASLPINDLTIRLWLYRKADADQVYFRLSAEAGMDVPMLSSAELRVTVDGKAYESKGPQADGLKPTDLGDL